MPMLILDLAAYILYVGPFNLRKMQEVANLGLRAPDWPETVEGTYLRIDIPLIVPVLSNWLEGQQTGRLLSSSAGDRTQEQQ